MYTTIFNTVLLATAVSSAALPSTLKQRTSGFSVTGYSCENAYQEDDTFQNVGITFNIASAESDLVSTRCTGNTVTQGTGLAAFPRTNCENENVSFVQARLNGYGPWQLNVTQTVPDSQTEFLGSYTFPADDVKAGTSYSGEALTPPGGAFEITEEALA